MSVQRIIQESINKNPLGLKEAFAEELAERVRLALEAKMSDDENEDEDDDIDESFDLSDYTVEELEDFMMSEDFEQLDEISKKTLASYVKKAGSKAEKSWDKMKTQQGQSAKFGSLAYKNRHGAGVVGAQYDKKSQDAHDKAKQHEKDYNKRADGWELANKKLDGKAKVNPKD